MKRSKLLTLTALILTMLILLTACGNPKKPDIKLSKLLADDATPTDAQAPFTTLKEIAELSGLLLVTDEVSSAVTGTLARFVSEDGLTNYVYNISTGTVVWSGTDNETQSMSVTLGKGYTESNSVSYFVVKATDAKTQKVTATTLFSQNGEMLATATGSRTVVRLSDLLIFDEKAYRCDENETISYAFDLPAFSSIPSYLYKKGDTYYETEDTYVTAYDGNLERIGTYHLPIHLENDGGVLCLIPLENGNIFVQYAYSADPYSDNYTFIAEDEKIILITQIVNIKKETAKTIDCNYLIAEAVNMAQELDEDDGLNAKKYPVLGAGYRIENKKLSAECIVNINNKGDISELSLLNGQQIESIQLIAQNRWIVDTATNSYLVNEDGKILGDVTSAIRNGSYFRINEKIYDSSLNLLYDYSQVTFVQTVGNAFLLKDNDGRYLLYTGGTEPIVLTDGEPENLRFGYRYLMIQKDGVWTVYNEAGTAIGTINGEVQNRYANTSNSEAFLLEVTNAEGKTVYYHLG